MVATTTLIETTRQMWASDAACAAMEDATRLFFSDEIVDIAAAKRICAECPVMVDCLETALRQGEQFGVWGGQLFISGRIVTLKRRRGRPPKHPRPDDQLPMIPFPEALRHLQPA